MIGIESEKKSLGLKFYEVNCRIDTGTKISILFENQLFVFLFFVYNWKDQ